MPALTIPTFELRTMRGDLTPPHILSTSMISTAGNSPWPFMQWRSVGADCRDGGLSQRNIYYTTDSRPAEHVLRLPRLAHLVRANIHLERAIP